MSYPTGFLSLIAGFPQQQLDDTSKPIQGSEIHHVVEKEQLLEKTADRQSSRHAAQLEYEYRHRGLDTSTAYAEDTAVMMGSHLKPLPPIHQIFQEAPYILTFYLLPGSHLLPTSPHSPTRTPLHRQPTRSGSRATHFPFSVHKQDKDQDSKPAAEERFAIRNLGATLEVEQGLADLRGLLGEAYRRGNDGALEELRVAIRGAVLGEGRGG